MLSFWVLSRCGPLPARAPWPARSWGQLSSEACWLRASSAFSSFPPCFIWSRSGPVQAGNGSCSLLPKAHPPRLTRMKPHIFLLSAALLASGCTVGPNYKRPTAAVPGSYRGTTSDEAAQTQLAALGDQKWWDILQDEQLRTLIRTALTQNYDSRIAASRVLEAQSATRVYPRRSVSKSKCRSWNFRHPHCPVQVSSSI